MRPRDVERELHRDELARFHHGSCDGPIIGTVTKAVDLALFAHEGQAVGAMRAAGASCAGWVRALNRSRESAARRPPRHSSRTRS
jgi:hypothetical protein